MMIAYCYATGRIRFGTKVPHGAIEIARGPSKLLKNLIGAVARHGYKRGVLLVPGVPEAADQKQGGDALAQFCDWIAKSKPEGITVNVARY
jgi:hypothetical protein